MTDDAGGGPEVLLDTNALMMPTQFGVDLVGEVSRLVGAFHAVIPAGVMAELEAMAVRPGHARTGLALARKFLSDGRARPGREWAGGAGSVDQQILREAVELGCPVVTNDKELMVRLKEEGARVIRLRGGDHLAWD